MKQLGTIIDFDIPSKSGVINLEDGSNINFLQENIGLNVKGELLLNKPVIVYHEKFRVSNVIPQDHMSYNEEDKVIPPKIEVPVSNTSLSSRSEFFTYLPWGLIFVLLVWGVDFNKLGNFGNLFGPTKLSNMTCDDVAKQVKDMKLKNLFGREYSILKIRNLELKSKNESVVHCTGELTTDDGEVMEYDLKMTREDNETFISVERLPLE